MANKTNDKELKPWNNKQTMLLVTTRLKYEKEFCSGKRKKSSLWTTVLHEMKKVDKELPFNSEDAQRKFNNMLITFKRIKQINAESGKDATKWEYFESFNNIYGSKHFIKPPKSHLIGTLESDCEIMSEEDDGSPRPLEKRPKKSKNEMLEYLKDEAVEEERRHKEAMAIEEKRVEILSGIKDILERLLP